MTTNASRTLNPFGRRLAAAELPALTRRSPTTLQVNVGKLCDLACVHCHVEAGPGRKEIMGREVAERVLELVEKTPGVATVDLTGGAPELNPHFRRLVGRSRELGRDVMVRSNLTALLLESQRDTIDFLGAHRVKMVASLPCYSLDNVDRQRGDGTFEGSIEALHRLNAAGYGKDGSGLALDLVFNPLGPVLPPPQADLEVAYKRELAAHFGIVFDRLYTITNMPIKRFEDQLRRDGRLDEYNELLVESFNAATVADVMCRDLVSVGWDGRLFDCDFNQMLELPLGVDDAAPRTVFDVETLDALEGRHIRTASHCFGCTAGSGSSCGGALTDPA